MKVFVAMSGGVDSSVAAALLKEQGHDVIGITMILTDGNAAADAKDTAARLGIPHETVDFRSVFKTCVMDSYEKSYAGGSTPNPCVTCNDKIKFGALLDAVLGKGADALATGHYARIQESKLLKGVDYQKDQSYFLYRLNGKQLPRIVFPLGEMTKEEVKRKARELDLPAAARQESQDVCFSIDAKSEPGDIVNTEGKVIGRHHGIAGLTVGQRKGLGIASPRPLYVLAIDGASGRVVAGPREEGFKEVVVIGEASWVAGQPPASEFRAMAKVRYNSPEEPASVTVSGGAVNIVFDKTQFAPAPGQSLVMYDGEAVLGGGIIRESY